MSLEALNRSRRHTLNYGSIRGAGHEPATGFLFLALGTFIMSNELIVFITASSDDEAGRLGETLVSERLAACVNIIRSVESIYRWEGKVTRDHELLLIVKTTAERYSELESRVKELHSYTTPEVIAFKIEHGSDEYLRWLRESARKDVEQEP